MTKSFQHLAKTGAINCVYIERMQKGILSIIAERCWLKDDKSEMELVETLESGTHLNLSPNEFTAILTVLQDTGWRPVKEIKKEE